MLSQRQKNEVNWDILFLRLPLNVTNIPVHFTNKSGIPEAKLKELISNMSRTDYRNAHSRMQALRHPGTGGWFKALPGFKAWFEDIRSSVICCHGIRELKAHSINRKSGKLRNHQPVVGNPC
jgi:hypothetical protein